MMTFKQFYLQSSKGDQSSSSRATELKTPKRRNKILDRIAKLKAAKRSVSPHV